MSGGKSRQGFYIFIMVLIGLSLGLVACGDAPTSSNPVAVNPATPTSAPDPTTLQAIAPTSTQPSLASTAISPGSKPATPTVIVLSGSNATPPIFILSGDTPYPDGVFTPVIAPTLTPYVTTVARPTATVTAVPSPTPTVNNIAPVVVGGDQPDSEEQAFLVALNSFRQANGRGPLTFEPLLLKSARWMAQDMAVKNYIGHKDSLGRDIVTRIKSFGYSGNWPGENIAGGFEHAADNLAIWQSDDIHRNNLLGAYYTKAGVGRYYKADSYNRWYWVLDLG